MSTNNTGNTLSSEQWAFYDQNGYVKLGKLLSDADLAALQQRIDDIMLGKASLDYNNVMMQLDSSSGNYADAGAQTMGHKGATLNYRKIQQLEYDPLYLEYMQRPIFKHICDRVYGPDVKSISCFRAMFMNKPAHKGTYLPWHQDRWNFLNRDPLITVWTALDPATVANGCVQVIPGSHKLGVLNPSHGSGFLTDEMAKAQCTPDKAIFLELKAGEVALLHNYLLHSSDVNKTDISRRAFSVCYMDGRTALHEGVTHREKFNTIFGEGAMKLEELQPA